MKERHIFFCFTVFLFILSATGFCDLVHRYSFSWNVRDSVGGAHGTLVNGTRQASFVSGQLVLGNSGQNSNGGVGDYVDLPNGIISALGSQATFECWATWTGNSSWDRFFDFGTSNAGEDSSAGGEWSTYIFLTPHGGSGVLRLGFRNGPTNDERGVEGFTLAPGEHHLAVTWDETASSVCLYLDGQLVGTSAPHFQLADMTDNNNWLGRSQWGDPFFRGSYNEVRLWNHAMSDREVLQSYLVGPDGVPSKLVSIEESGDVTQVSEEGVTDAFTVVLGEQPTAEVEVTFTPQSDDIELNGGFAGDPAVLTFSTADWSTPKQVSVAAVADSMEEGNEVVLVEGVIDSADSRYGDAYVPPIAVTVIDTKVNPCPTGDIDGDCRVGLGDLQIMAVQWLDASGCIGPDCGDLTGDDGVNLEDMSVLAGAWMELYGPVVINEFMASNASDPEAPMEPWEVVDETGESTDWIELYNVSQQPVSMDGWYLTDDAADPRKWAFPVGVEIPAQSYLLIYASGKDAVSGAFIHTNFSLSQDGEYLALVSPEGVVCEYAGSDGAYPAQEVNISYGLFEYFTAQRYFYPATPGQPNRNSSLGIAPDTRFSVDHGFFAAPFSVAITTDDPEAQIRYTLDGSTPTQSNGTVYTSPITIHKTTTLRAASFKTGYLPGSVDTQTYLFVNDIIAQSPQGQVPGTGWPADRAVNNHRMDYGMDPDIVNSSAYGSQVDDALLAIPTLSLVSDLQNWFNPTNGVYVNTGTLTRTNGELFEKPCSMELIYPDGRQGFQIDCGVRIRGGASRNVNNPKHSLHLYFRSEYGAGKLVYPMFEEEGVGEFDKLDLRTAANYAWSYFNSTNNFHNTFLRDEFSRRIQGNLGRLNTKGRYYHLYLNGQYWGLYQTQERADSRFAASYLGGMKEDYDAIKVDNIGHVVVATDGNLEAYRRLYDAVIDGVDTEEYFRLQGQNPGGGRNPAYERLLDVDNLIDYMLITYYTADYDGPGSRFTVTNNFSGIYNRKNPDGFKWLEHDSEHSFGTYEMDGSHRENMVTPFTSSGSNFTYFNPHWLHEQLANQCPEYRLRFADRAQELFFNDGAFTADRVWAEISALASQIDTAIIAESARWGDANAYPPRTRDTWLQAVQFMKDYVYGTRSTFTESHATDRQNWPQQRREVRVVDQFRSVDWLPDLDAPQFSQHGGYVAAGYALTMSNPNSGGTIYYTTDGTDPRQGPTDGPGSQTYVLAAEETAKWVQVPSGPINQWAAPDYSPTGWTSGSGAVGYENSPGDALNYSSLISDGIDVKSTMYGVNRTCYIRIPFEYNGQPINQLTLRMRYDDGFVAFLNGSEIARDNVDTSSALSWNTGSPTHRDDNLAITPTDIDISSAIGLLQTGSNLLAIQGLNTSLSSSDFLITAELIGIQDIEGNPSANAVAYTSPVMLAESTEVKARVWDGSDWSALNQATFAVGPVRESLRVTELMYHPADPNGEFIEIWNIGAEAVNLNLVEFDDGISHRFGSQSVSPGGFVLLVEDLATFNALYPDVPAEVPVIQWESGSLSNAGERLTFRDAAGTVIQSFEFNDWYPLTDGPGYSLTLLDPLGTDLESWSLKGSWTTSTHPGGSPGRAETPLAAGSIVINEVLAHSHDEAPDWIELYNTTASPIAIGGWYLSDDEADPMKYRIPDGEVIEGYGYYVFDENTHFGVAFRLSENGEVVCLSAASEGGLLGYQVIEDFGASPTGIAFGRYQKSTGGVDFVLMSSNTPGAANSAPVVGPVVISEIMYHPQVNADAEYVELLNISGAPVDLWMYDSAENETVGWRLMDEGGFVLDIAGQVTLAAGERMLLLKSLADFQAEYGSLPAGIRYQEWTSGSLSNGGEKIEFQRPGDMGPTERYYIRVERVNYGDISPWPVEPDGDGKALGRIIPGIYANDPGNWQAVDPSPGR